MPRLNGFMKWDRKVKGLEEQVPFEQPRISSTVENEVMSEYWRRIVCNARSGVYDSPMSRPMYTLDEFVTDPRYVVRATTT